MSVVFNGYSTNKTDRHDITEILLKVALNTINQPTVHIILIQSQPVFTCRAEKQKYQFNSEHANHYTMDAVLNG